jgi:putative transposase
MPLESPLDKQKGVRAGQYTSQQFQRLMADNGVDCSMSRSGSVWTCRHRKLLLVAENRTDRQKRLPDADAARADVFDDIERFYHTIRRHSTIGYLSLVEFERKVGLAQLPAAAQTACAAN